jgi:hypothetical protein
VELDDLGEEGMSHCCRRVGVAEGYEVCRFGKVIHHGENDSLAVDLGKPSMKSMDMLAQIADGTLRGCNKPVGWRCSVLFF